MPLPSSEAARCAVLALIAENLFLKGKTTPKPSQLIADMGLTPVALLVATDKNPLVVVKTVEGVDQTVALVDTEIGFDEESYYGFLASDNANPQRFVVVVRGTMDPAEWAIDARFPYAQHPDGAALKVESGFWSVYATMKLVDLDGLGNPVSPAATGIAARVGTGSVTVIGHSLGSAIATYLTYDLAKYAQGQVSACLFASPRTGNDAWVAAFQAKVTDYALYDYILDIVPKVPFDAPGLNYAALPNETVLDPRRAQANISFDVMSHHHAICYAAMLDYAWTAAWPGVVNEATWASVKGPFDANSLNYRLAASVAAMLEEFGAFGLTAARMIQNMALAKGAHV